MFLALLTTAMVATACGSSTSNSSANKKSSSNTTKTVAATSAVSGTFYELYQSCPSNPFWVAVNNGGKAAAAQLGVHLKIEDPLHCTGEVAQEQSLLTTIINSHPAGIALSLVSETAFQSDIQKARRLHIPIIAYNSIPHNVSYTANPVQAYVGQSNYAAGVALAKKAVKLYHLKSGDTVLTANNCPINVSCDDRFLGFKSVVGSMGVNLPNLNVNYNVSKSIGIVKSYFELHGRPTLAMSFGSAGVEAVVKAAKEMHYTSSQLPVVGFDFDPVTLKYMKEGWFRLTVDQQPFLQGYDALVNLYTAVRYKDHPINMSTGPEYVQNTSVDASKGWLTPSVVSQSGI